jgi:hypothetical protein
MVRLLLVVLLDPELLAVLLDPENLVLPEVLSVLEHLERPEYH